MNDKVPRSDRKPPPSLRGLILLNAALLLVLAAVTFAPLAGAQGRQRGQYTMVAGGVNNLESDAVYVVDVINQEMIAFAFNPNSKALDGIGYRNLAVDAGTRRRGN